MRVVPSTTAHSTESGGCRTRALVSRMSQMAAAIREKMPLLLCVGTHDVNLEQLGYGDRVTSLKVMTDLSQC